jgi:hypothetical protein
VPRLQPGGREPLWESAVGDQRRLNLHLVGKSEADFVALREALDRTLPMPKLILHALQVNVRGGRLPELASNAHKLEAFAKIGRETAQAPVQHCPQAGVRTW